MKRTHSVCLGLLLAGVASGGAAAQSFEADVAPLVETSCMTCHGARTATPLDITSLGQDLTDRATFRAWERIYERVENGEMPPRGVRRPDAAVVDLTGPRAVEFTPYLRPGDLIGLSVADLDVPPEAASFLALDDPSKGYGGMKDYPGEGIAFRSLTIDGPLLESDAWPPARTRQLLVGVEFDDFGGVRLTKAPYEHVVDIVARFAPRAFRRPLEDGELEAYASLAEPLLAEGRPFIEAVRVPLRAILSAPAFLYQMGDAGPLDDFALASRLSYFLWHSMPDARLFDAARAGRLSDPAVLAGHVDRMLDDAKADRFVRDFTEQGFRLYELRATTPDAGLYPEYDDRIGQAMAQETELFLRELVDENRGVDHLIAADFTFANRRLAEHYGLSGVAGQQMRRVALPADSPRGGLMTHASVLKVTANGTTTSPVPRGTFVLANLLGKPPPPPPPGIEGLEPDTRGTTTIREQLTAHRANPAGLAASGLYHRGGDRVRGPGCGGDHRGAARRRRISHQKHDSRGRSERSLQEPIAMTLTRPVDRRTFLRASGVAMGLPLLESMAPALARAAAVEAPQRMVTICTTLGLYSSSWFPRAAGADYETTEYLRLIDEHRSRYTLFSGFSHEEQSGRQPHNSEITWLTAARRPGLDGFRNTVSLDQVAANQLGYVTRFPSVVLGTLSSQSQSFTRSGAMVPAETSPANLFRKLFLQGTPEEVEREAQSLNDGGSILDRLKSQTTALRGRVSAADRRKLDAYFDAVRAAEREITEVQAWLDRPKPVVGEEPPADIPNPADLLGRIRLMFRMIPLILETDSSRVVSMMLHDHGVVPQVQGVSGDQHSLSHHGQDEAKIAQLKKIETEVVRAFGDLLGDLQARGDASGSLLDRTTILFGSNLGNANAHTPVDLPILVAGADFAHGKHVVHEGVQNAPLCNLFVTLLQGMGVETEEFGQSTGTLTWS